MDTGLPWFVPYAMRRLAPWLPVALAVVLGAPGVIGSAAAPESLNDVLRRTAAWVDRFADEALYVVADERYVQETWDAGAVAPTERRELRSEIALVRTPPEDARFGFPWVQLRDVIEVDGTPLPDRQGRLAALFRHASASSYQQASSLIEESARFNIGPIPRTVNVPSFVLFLLTARNQPRFRFRHVGDESIDGVAVTLVTYDEQERPTIVKSLERRDRPVKGRVWIEPATGRVLRTRLEAEAARTWTVAIDVEYGRDAPTGLWVPLVMREHFGDRKGAHMDGVARYANFRRFETDARLVR